MVLGYACKGQGGMGRGRKMKGMVGPLTPPFTCSSLRALLTRWLKLHKLYFISFIFHPSLEERGTWDIYKDPKSLRTKMPLNQSNKD